MNVLPIYVAYLVCLAVLALVVIWVFTPDCHHRHEHSPRRVHERTPILPRHSTFPSYSPPPARPPTPLRPKTAPHSILRPPPLLRPPAPARPPTPVRFPAPPPAQAPPSTQAPPPTRAPLRPQPPPRPQTPSPSPPPPRVSSPPRAPPRRKAPPRSQTPYTENQKRIQQSTSQTNTSSVQPESSGDSLRRRADTEADAMKRARQAARQARQAGQRAMARQLDQAAQGHQTEMERLNHEASHTIFRDMNRPGKQPQGTIDLHGGLWVEEAEEHTTREIENALQRGDAEIRIIVGQGIHASDGKAKIRPAIEELLHERGIGFKRDRTNAGELVVQLKRGDRSQRSGGISSRL